MADDTERLKVNKSYSQIQVKFRGVAKFLPFSVMTHDQLHEMVAPEETVGLIIVDEASQSECTAVSRKFIRCLNVTVHCDLLFLMQFAVSVLFRCNQMVVIGDDKQVSPKTMKNDWTNEINALAPRIPCRFQLQNDRNLFDVIKVAFPSKRVHMFMREHFRSDPRIARVINELDYNSKLQPMRSLSPGEALIDSFVDTGHKP